MTLTILILLSSSIVPAKSTVFDYDTSYFKKVGRKFQPVKERRTKQTRTSRRGFR